MAPIPRTIGDFSILPIEVPPLPSYTLGDITHHLYLRRHAPKNPTADDTRRVFVTNTPADSTELHFRAIVVALVGPGRFDSIKFEGERRHGSTSIATAQAAKLAAITKKRKRADTESTEDQRHTAKLPDTWSRLLRRSGGTAILTLVDDKSVDQLLKAITKAHKVRKYPTWGAGIEDKVPSLGSTWFRFHQTLSYPGKAALQASTDAYFTIFNHEEQNAAELAKRLRSEPDEDGFVTVTRGGTKGAGAPARRDEAEEAKKKMLDKAEKKKQEMQDFYRFQHRERKKAEQAEMLKKFDEDKRKIQALRQKRVKLRPET